MTAFLFLLLFLSLPAHAAETFGIAMHGSPKYDAPAQTLSYVNKSAPTGGALRQGYTGTFDTLNPFALKGTPAQGLDFVFDRLAYRTWDEPFSLYGLVAEKMIVAPDRSAITFILNPKARFHDGVSVTADDIRYTFENLRDKGRPNMRRVYKLVKQVVVDGPHKIRFELGQGYDRESVMILAMMPVMAKHWWEKHDLGQTTLEPPPGTGPYKITAVDAGRGVTLTRVAHDWAAGHLARRGQFNFDTIQYQYFRDDSVALAAFKKGTLDVRREPNLQRWLSAYNDVPEDVTLSDIPHGRPEPARGFIFNLRRAPFDNADVRRALSLAFDRDYLIETMYRGRARSITSLFPNTELAADGAAPAAPPRREALLQASRLLDAAGYKVVNGARDINFTITLGNPAEEKIALHWARGLKALGVKTRIKTMDAAQFAGALSSFDYDVVLHQWLNSLSPGSEQMIFWSCQAAHSEGSRNYAGLCDATVDSAARRIATTKTRNELVAAARDLDRAVMAQTVFIPLVYEGVDHWALHKNILHPEKAPLYGAVQETFWMDNRPAR